MKNISVLIPSRGNPDKCADSIHALLNRAAKSESVEIILRLDGDDPELSKYQMRPCLTIVGPRMGGYKDLSKMYEECARAATGKVLLIYNDDLECMTHNWDMMYSFRAIIDTLRPMCSVVTGDHYQWAFPAIPRPLYERVGCLCPGDSFVVDRVWHAVARARGWSDEECNSGVHLHHNRVPPEEGAEDRKLFMREVEKDFPKLQEQWDKAGREIAARL